MDEGVCVCGGGEGGSPLLVYLVNQSEMGTVHVTAHLHSARQL